MFQISLRIVVLSLLFASLVGCQSKLKNGQTKGIQYTAERQQDRQPDDIGSKDIHEYEKDFLKLFSEYTNEIKVASAGSDEKIKSIMKNNIFANKLFTKGLKKTYHYMYKFDEELQQINDDCDKKRRTSNNPDLECQNVLDGKTYRRLRAYRALNLKIQKKLTYYYLRLLDIRDSMSEKKNPYVFAETKIQMENPKYNRAERQSMVSDAAGILNQWDTGLTSMIDLSQQTTDSVLAYDAAIELFKLKEKARIIYATLRNEEYSASSLVNAENDYITYYESNITAYKNEATRAASDSELEEVLEIEKDLSEVRNSRTPDREFKNFTGNTFPKGNWALTYDDGPKEKTTRQIYNLLRADNTPATFFWLAKNATSSSNKKIVQDIAGNSAMSLASHSYSHANLGKRGANLKREIVDAKHVLEKVYGRSLNFFRLPYGSGTKSARVRKVIQDNDLWHFFWNVDSLDWKDPSPRSIYNRIRKQMKNRRRGIILMHDIHQKTVETSRLLLDYFKSSSQDRVKSLDQLVGRSSSNGALPKEHAEDKADEAFDKPEEKSTFPHYRRIIVSRLNVRNKPGVNGSVVCGWYQKFSLVQAIGQSGTWYEIDLSQNPPQPNSGEEMEDISNKCPNGKGFITPKTRYSVKELISH